MDEAYVYQIVVDGVIRYIGKGRRGRAWSHLAYAKKIIALREDGERVKTTLLYNKLAKAVLTKRSVSVKIIKNGMSDEDAFAAEVKLIAKHRGTLWNVRDGGEGWSSAESKALWADPKIRKKLKAGWKDPARLAAHALRNAELMTTLWSDPDFREMQSKKSAVVSKEMWENADLEKRERMMRGLKQTHSDPFNMITTEANERRIQATIDRWANAGYKKNIAKKNRIAALAQFADPEKKARWYASRWGRPRPEEP